MCSFSIVLYYILCCSSFSVNKPDHASYCESGLINCDISDHLPCITKLVVAMKENTSEHYVNLSDMSDRNLNLVKDMLNEIDLMAHCRDHLTLDECINSMTEEISQCIDECCPLTKKKRIK